MSLKNKDSISKILVMDDEEHIRNITQKMLEKFGYTVVLAGDGQEAVTAYQNAMNQGHGFDLVIMDLTIPGGMGGKEAAKLILEIDPGARVVVSSGYSNDPVMSNFKEYGLCGIIPKPYRLTELKETVATLVSGLG